MSTQLNGLPDAIVFATSVSITSTTDATPIVVAATAHGMTTGDACSVYDHTVNTNANGEWSATVLTANTFSLDGSVGTGAGAGGATGTVQPLSCGATFQIPADGDPRSAATVGVPFEALADRTALLSAGTGKLKLAITDSAEFDPGATVSGPVWATITQTGTPSAWASIATLLTVHGVQANDYVDFWLTTTALITSSGTGVTRLSLGYSLDAPGVSPTPATLQGTGQIIVVGGTVSTPIHLRGVITNAAKAGTLTLYVGARSNVTASTTVALYDSHLSEVKVWRPTIPGSPTGFPQ